MAAPQSLSALVDSVVTESGWQPDQAVTETDPANVGQPESTDGTAKTETEGEGTPAETATPSLIGIKTEQPAEDATGKETSQWKLEVSPETVIAMSDDGKPITAGEVQSGYMRNKDYTLKTQEMSEFRKTAEPALQFIQHNESILKDLVSQDPAVRRSAVERIAKENDVDLGQSQARNEKGQFSKQSKYTLHDLSQLDEGSEEYEAAEKWNSLVENNQALESQVGELSGKFDQFIGTVQSAQTQATNMGEAEAIARGWQASGLANVELAGAMSLVGQPITVDQAMHLANLEAILAHNARVSGASPKETPNEPGGTPPRSHGVSAKGKSMTAFVNETVR